MALRGIQEYIARDANNIARVIQYYYYYSYRALCVILLKRKKALTQQCQHGNTNAMVFNVLNIQSSNIKH